MKKNAGTTRRVLLRHRQLGQPLPARRHGLRRPRRGASTSRCRQQAEAAAERFYERIDAPVLTDVAIDWGGLPVADVYPKLIPDLFSDKPVVVTAG